jgi:hypothetical protein
LKHERRHQPLGPANLNYEYLTKINEATTNGARTLLHHLTLFEHDAAATPHRLALTLCSTSARVGFARVV